ncbi:MAG: helix-turn-helix domain-containing protein, partial [Candidatus Acidiferrales bacterium]
MAQTEAACVFGLARGTINGWVNRAKRQGLRTLRARRRGRPPRSRLDPHQAATAVRMILSGCPD